MRDTGRSLRTVALFLSVSIALCPSADAVEVSPRIPQTLDVADQHLTLNGYGARKRWDLTIYECALYVPHRSASTSYILSPSTPSALRIRLTFDPPATVPDRWKQTFRSELSHEVLDLLRQTYERLDSGDVVLFAYAPGHGTSTYRNGHLLFTDEGHGLMVALLDQWIGSRPVSRDLRDRLLYATAARPGASGQSAPQ